MVIIISGLPGTGKTSLCKKIEKEFDFEYISDWQIFKQKNISFKNFENKNKISNKYSKHIIDYILDNVEKNIVCDLEYSINPNNYSITELSYFTKHIYLGFIKLPTKTLFNNFKNNSNNDEISNNKLLKKIKFYKKMSKNYKKECKKYNLQFIDINENKNFKLEKTLVDLKNYISTSNITLGDILWNNFIEKSLNDLYNFDNLSQIEQSAVILYQLFSNCSSGNGWEYFFDEFGHENAPFNLIEKILQKLLKDDLLNNLKKAITYYKNNGFNGDYSTLNKTLFVNEDYLENLTKQFICDNFNLYKKDN